MIAYIYFEGSKIINSIIEDVISINDEEIIGQNGIARFDGGSQFVVIEDSINKNIGEIIDISVLTDCRDFFIKGANYWYQEQIKKQKDLINSQQDLISNDEDTINYILTDILPTLMS